MYADTADGVDRFGDYLTVWGPKILAAIAILVVAWLVGKAVKWGVAKLVDKLPGTHHANEGAGKKETVGARLGEVAHWLVLLIGVIAALTVLQLGQVVQPLNQMLQQFFGFVPRIVGAGVIFFVGFILATLAKRVVVAALEAANLDRWTEKAGLNRVTGGGGLAKAIGTLVFVLIIIPVAIQALTTLNIRSVSDPAVAVLSTILNAIPSVLAAAIVLAIAFFIGRWVKTLIETTLPSFGFDNSIRGLGLFPEGSASSAGASSIPPSPTGMTSMPGEAPSPMASAASAPDAAAAATTPAGATGGGMTPSKVVANIAFFAIMIFAAVEAARLLEFLGIAEVLQEILALGGRVIFGGVIIAAGVILATLLSNAINRSTGGADGFASTLVRWATIALATAMGLRFMGIADEIVIIAFALILGSAAVAAALAFGIGGRNAAGRLADRWARKAEEAQDRRPPA